MASIKVKWTVDELSNVMLVYDQTKVYRSTTGIGGTYVEITGPSTRVDLVVGQTLYEFIDLTGDPTYWYKTAYFNSVNSDESTPSDPIQGDAGYCSLQDVRDAGLPDENNEGIADAEVLRLIQLFSGLIDRVTRCFFNSRTKTLLLDGTGHESLFLPYPIIDITSLEHNLVEDAGDIVPVGDFAVYNRELRGDKMVPRLTLINEAGTIFTGTSAGIFRVGHQNQRVIGTFGWLEDGNTPLPIKDALLRLIIRNAGGMATGAGGPLAGGWGKRGVGGKEWDATKERADRHSITRTDAFLKTLGADATVMHLINDPVAYAEIMQYRIMTPKIAYSSRNTERGMMSSV